MAKGHLFHISYPHSSLSDFETINDKMVFTVGLGGWNGYIGNEYWISVSKNVTVRYCGS